MYRSLGEVYAAFIEDEITAAKRGEELSQPTEIEILRSQLEEARNILQSFVDECNKNNLEQFTPEYEQAVDWLKSLEGGRNGK